jgi:hypothetical protein
MVPTHLPPHIRMIDHAREKRRRRVHGQKPLPVLGVGRSVPNPVVNREADEPTEEKANSSRSTS